MRSTKIKKNFCSSSLCTCLHDMVIYRSQNKINYFLMILAWASPFKASFYTPENILNFHTTKGFRTKISMKLVYQYLVIFFNSRLVVYEDDNVKSGFKGLITSYIIMATIILVTIDTKKHLNNLFARVSKVLPKGRLYMIYTIVNII